jgi:DNA-binding NarL/FixJ family response regulator
MKVGTGRSPTGWAITAGAHGYLVKPVTAQKLVEAIREIREGGVPMSRAV